MNLCTNSYLFFLLLLFTSCSNEIETGIVPGAMEEAAVPIRISSEWIEASTKAVVKEFTADNVGNIGIFGTDNTTIQYKGISPSGIENGQLTFQTTPLVYPVNGLPVLLSGYYPKQSDTGERFTIDNSGLLNFRLTGTEDLMFASPADAGNKKVPKIVSLLFAHKLTCVSFKLINGIINNATPLPDGNISIITQAPNEGTMDLRSENGTLNISKTQASLSLKSDLRLQSLPADTTQVEGALMLIPVSAETGITGYTFQLAVGNNTYAISINDMNAPVWEEGVCYELTITIKNLTPLNEQETKATGTGDYRMVGTIRELK